MIKAAKAFHLLTCLCLFWSLSINVSVYAQADLGAGFNPEANVPPSPEAASLGKYGDVPVSNYSGIANIDVPLYTVQSKDISVPISMSYFSNGIGVTEEAGWTGLGWTLNAGGMISHSIRGKDDFGYSQNCDSYIPYYNNLANVPNYPIHPNLAPNNAMWKKMGTKFTALESVSCPGECNVGSGVYNVSALLNDFWFQTTDEGWDLTSGNYEAYNSDFFCPNTGPKQDLEPDLFNFNFLGFSGKFVIDRAGNCIPLDKQDIKIEISGVAPAYAWIITTNDGTKYYFGTSATARQVTGTRSTTHTINNGDVQNPVSSTNSCNEGYWNEYVSSWHLEKIESVNGDLVNFSYDKASGQYIFPIPAFSESANDLAVSALNAGGGLCFGTVPNTTASVLNRTITKTRYEAVYLQQIEYEFGKVDFIASTNRADLLGAKRLEVLEIYQGNTAPFTAVKKYVFNYDYFQSTDAPYDNQWNSGYSAYQGISTNRINKRLKLVSIEDRGNQFSNPPSIPPYTFAYRETYQLPSKTSMSMDHWGYANGTYNTSSLPEWEGIIKTSLSGENYLLNKIAGADKSPNPFYTAAFLLEKITYPTGGFTELVYEANHYTNLADPYEGNSKLSVIKYLPNDAGERPPPEGFSVSVVQKYPVAFANLNINWNILGATTGACAAGGTVNRVDENLAGGVGFKAVLRNTLTGATVKEWLYDSPQFERSGNSFQLQEQLNLTPGESYEMELLPTCQYANGSLPENTIIAYSINWLDYAIVNQKVGGGMRIKSITDYDGVNVQGNKKWFEYTDNEGACSGIAINHPEYMKVKAFNGGCESLSSSAWAYRDMLARSSNSVTPLSKAAAGSFIGYSEVVMHYGENDEGGKTVFSYYNEEQVNESGGNPEGIALFYNQKNGSLLKQVDYKKFDSVGEETLFVPVKAVENFYNDFQIGQEKWIWGLLVTGNPWVNTAAIDACINYRTKLYAYASVPQWHYVSASVETNYDENGANPIVSQTAYTYDEQYYSLLATSTVNSDGTAHGTETAYAYSTDPAIADANLMAKNMTGIPLEVKQTVGGTVVSGARLKYEAVAGENGNSRLLPTNFYKYEYNSNAPEADNWTWRGELKYNTQGYPSELIRPAYADNYYYHWEEGLLQSRSYKDWTWEYSYTPDRLLKTMTNMDGLISGYTYDRYRRLQSAKSRDGNIEAVNHYVTGLGSNYIETELIYSDADNQLTKKLFDGLGRPTATIAMGHGVNFENVTTESYDYDVIGRAYLSSHYVSGDVEKELEASPLARVLKEKSYLDQGEVIVEYHYYSNDQSDEVINHGSGNSGGNGSGFYPPQTLYKTVVINENGNKAITFTDQLGRTVLSRRFVNVVDGVDNETPENRVDTYTLYDERGNVREVISPGDNGTSGPSYTYEYDPRNLLIKKTIPNAGEQSFTYDDRYRLATSTDANGNVITTTYDDYDRPTMTSLGGDHGGVLSQTFYDGNYGPLKKYCPNGASGDILKGKIVGTRVRTLEQDGLGTFISTINCYDQYGRVIYTNTDNHIGGQDETDILVINHADQVEKSKRTHESSYGNYEIEQDFVFDHAFRLKDVFHQVNGTGSVGVVGNAAAHLSQMNYNNKDQVIQKNLHVGAQGALQSIDYQYNAKGWLTHINEVNTGAGLDPLGVCPAPQVLGDCATCLPPGNGGPVSNGEDKTLSNPSISLQFNASELNANQASTLQLEQSYTLQSGATSTNVSVSQLIKIGDPVGTSTYTNTATASLENVMIDQVSINNQVNALMVQLEQVLGQSISNASVLNNVKTQMTTLVGNKWQQELPVPPANGSANNDLFKMRLHYDRGDNLVGSTPQYNGNIAQIFWQVGNREAQSYAFQYDELDRLKVAKYSDVRNDKYLQGDHYTVNNLSYDARGNIKTLSRYGLVAASETCHGQWKIDDLEYGYNGNQLSSVTDKATHQHSDEGYKGGGSYLYDANGNMTRDNNKQMTIEYNHLNLPKKFIFDSEDDNLKFIEILYDAAGIKLQKKVYDGENTMIKDYVSGIEYQDNQLEAIYHEEGRVVPTAEGFRYEYTLKDHLGNARISFSDLNGNGVIDETVETMESYETEVLQENHYYPFGMNMKGPWAPQLPPKNMYQYNGKELNEDLGLDWSDYGARWYDASIGRFYTADRFSEKYYDLTPYQYVADNPISSIDINGDSIIVLNAEKAVGGAGHAAVLIGSDNPSGEKGKGGWYLYSDNGTNGGSLGSSNRSTGDSDKHPEIKVGPFNSVEDFANSDSNLDSEGNQVYTEGYLLPSDSKTDDQMKDAAAKEVREPYNVLNNSCIDVCSAALEAGGFDGGAISTTGSNNPGPIGPGSEHVPKKLKSPIPNVRYKAIKANNTGGTVITKEQLKPKK